MKEAFEKIVERLEIYEYNNLIEHNEELSEHCKKTDCDSVVNCSVCIMDKAISIVNEIAEEYNNGWISCSEIDKLPKDGTPVLVQDYEDYYEVYYCETKRGMKGFSDGDWWSSPNNYKAWQPLPEPYQPKGE